MLKFAPIAVLVLALGACHALPVGIAASGGSAVAIATAASTATTVLSDTAKVACALQAAANDLGNQLPNGSHFAATASKWLGYACTW